MSMMLRFMAVVGAALFGSACDQRAAFERLVPKDDAAYGQRVVDQLRRHDYPAIENALNPDLKSRDAVRPQLEQAAALFPAGAPRSVQVIGASINTVNDTRFVSLFYEYEFPDRWLVADIMFRQQVHGPVQRRAAANHPARLRLLQACPVRPAHLDDLAACGRHRVSVETPFVARPRAIAIAAARARARRCSRSI
jgi:hypothetical protein